MIRQVSKLSSKIGYCTIVVARSLPYLELLVRRNSALTFDFQNEEMLSKQSARKR